MLGKRFSKQLKTLLTNLLLFPVFMGISIPEGGEGEGEGEGGTGGEGEGAGSGGEGSGEGEGEGGEGEPTYEQLSAQAKEIADKAEALRVSKLSPEDKAAEEAAQKANEVPEEYADFTVPENMQLDNEVLNDFKPLAKELGLSQEKAQKLVDLYGGKVMPLMIQRQQDAWNNQLEAWKEQAKTDKEIGGEKFDASVSDAQRVVNTLGTPELKQLFDQYGIGNHPELVRTFSRMAKYLKEDTLEGDGKTGQQTPIEKKFYPGMN